MRILGTSLLVEVQRAPDGWRRTDAWPGPPSAGGYRAGAEPRSERYRAPERCRTRALLLMREQGAS